MMGNQKGVSLTVVLLLMTSIIFGAYFIVTPLMKPDPPLVPKGSDVSPTDFNPQPKENNDEISDDFFNPGWNIYKNKRGMYQISYPSDWKRTSIFNYYDYDSDLKVMD